MPELPEVERAVVALRRALVGRRLRSLVLHHPALARRMTAAQRRSVAGASVTAVTRRGKHQLIELADGRVLHAHFRMAGDWAIGPDAAVARYARATLTFDDGSRVVLDDPRALSSIELKASVADATADLGPEADDPAIGARFLADLFRDRRAPVKVLLLDQRLLAGIGNIYASEALWRAKIDPRRAAGTLDGRELARLLSGIRAVLRRATGARYSEGGRFDVYDREGRPCKRCKKPIGRFTQAGRSTYWCPNCQRNP